MLCLNVALFAQQPNKNMPFPSINGHKDGLISKEALLKVDSISCSDNQLKIISFTMSLTVGEDIQEDRSSSNLLSKPMKHMLSNVVTGSKIWFENISAKSTDGKVIMLNAIAFRVE